MTRNDRKELGCDREVIQDRSKDLIQPTKENAS